MYQNPNKQIEGMHSSVKQHPYKLEYVGVLLCDNLIKPLAKIANYERWKDSQF